MDTLVTDSTQGRQLDAPPPRPPRNPQSLMQMASGDEGTSGLGMDMSNPAVQVMKAMGDARNAFMIMMAHLPLLAQPLQQILQGLEAVVPQQVADLVAGVPPGSSGAGMGAPQANMQPSAPPVQAGMP